MKPMKIANERSGAATPSHPPDHMLVERMDDPVQTNHPIHRITCSSNEWTIRCSHTIPSTGSHARRTNGRSGAATPSHPPDHMLVKRMDDPMQPHHPIHHITCLSNEWTIRCSHTIPSTGSHARRTNGQSGAATPSHPPDHMLVERMDDPLQPH